MGIYSELVIHRTYTEHYIMYTDRRLADTNLTCQIIEPENELPTVSSLLLSGRESVTIVA